MNPLQLAIDIDQKISNVLESLCHRQQRFLGTSHYFWLKLFAVIQAAFTFVFLLPVSPPSERYIGWIIFGVFLGCVPGFTWWERRSLIRLSKGLANPLRRNGNAIFVRCMYGYVCSVYITATMVVAIMIDIRSIWIGLALILWWLTLASLYVLPVCDPLPPVAGKVRERLARIFLKPVSSAS